VQQPGDPILPIGEALAINLAAGQTVQIPTEPIFPNDPLHPSQLFLSFDGTVQDGLVADPAALHPNDPILPASPPPLGFQVFVGDVVAGVNINLPIVAWNASGPVIAGTANATLSADPDPQDTVLDDFTSGSLDRRAITCNATDATRAGSMVGSTRRMRLVVNNALTSCNSANPYRQPASVAVLNNTGPLLVGSGLRTLHRLELSWGQALNNSVKPMNLDLTGGGLFDRIRLTVTGNDRRENLTMAVYTGLGSGAGTVGTCAATLQPGAVETSVDIPLANLRPLFGNLTVTDADFLLLTLQSGTALGANDFALKSMVLTRSSQPAAVVCQ
jgi:hypothetical protein